MRRFADDSFRGGVEEEIPRRAAEERISTTKYTKTTKGNIEAAWSGPCALPGSGFRGRGENKRPRARMLPLLWGRVQDAGLDGTIGRKPARVRLTVAGRDERPRSSAMRFGKGESAKS